MTVKRKPFELLEDNKAAVTTQTEDLQSCCRKWQEGWDVCVEGKGVF